MNYLWTAALLGCALGWTKPVQAEPAVNYDFCTLSPTLPEGSAGDFSGEQLASLQPEFGRQVWSPVSVQYYTRKLLSQPGLIDTPAAAYPLSYVAMTAERDRQRCAGNLAIADRGARLIGDLLADVMSRWLVLSVRSCIEQGANSRDSAGLCAAVTRIKAQRYDAMRSALEMTGVYLSSHMAMALVAVAFDDPFWSQEFPPETHCRKPGIRGCGTGVMASRLAYIQRYRAGYDLNNSFLANNLGTVVEALSSACYLHGGLVGTGVELLGPALASAELFRTIRDQTFTAALSLARTIDPKTHPMLEAFGPGYRVQYRKYAAFAVMPQVLEEAESDARRQLGLPLLGSAFRALGSLGPVEMARLAPSTQSDCAYPVLPGSH